MSEALDLRLARHDLWRRHGALNVGMTLGCLAALPCVAAWLLSDRTRMTWDARSWTLAVIAPLVFLLMSQGVLRSLVATMWTRPYVTLTARGLAVDGGPLDRWFFPWREIDAMAPTLEHLQRCLTAGDFVAITLRLRERPRQRRLFSHIQHARFRDYFELSGYFVTLSEAEAGRVVAYFASEVRDHQPFLLSDMDL